MNKEKQIEEMAKTVCHLDRTCDQCMTSFECKAMTYAKRFYNAGYRKASDVASEIFEEIDKHRDRIHGIVLLLPEELAELKKKYTEQLLENSERLESEKDNG